MVAPPGPAGWREAATHCDVSTRKTCVESAARDSQALPESSPSAKAWFDISRMKAAAQAQPNAVLMAITGTPFSMPMLLCPGLFCGRLFARDMTEDDTLEDVAAALIMPAIDSAQFAGGIKPCE